MLDQLQICQHIFLYSCAIVCRHPPPPPHLTPSPLVVTPSNIEKHQAAIGPSLIALKADLI